MAVEKIKKGFSFSMCREPLGSLTRQKPFGFLSEKKTLGKRKMEKSFKGKRVDICGKRSFPRCQNCKAILHKGKTVGFTLMKGQMFMVSAVIIILSLVSLSNLLGVYRSVEETRIQESLILDRQLKNIKSEYEAIAAAAKLSDNVNGSAIRYLANFSELLRNAADVEIFYSFIYFNGTNRNYSVTIGNYLKDSINATVNVSNSTTIGASIGVIDDRKNATRTFESSISSGTLNVNITYGIRSENATEVIAVTVSGRNYVALFYDIKLLEGRDFVRIKDLYNATW